MKGGPRIVFMGTPAFAVPSLEACLALGNVVGVLTQPDKPRGRGQEVLPGAVKQVAERAGLHVLQPARLKGTDIAAELRALAPDVCVVTAYGKILPSDVLDVAAKGCVNVHASLLPRWRGAAPIQWAVASGDSETGVTLIKLDQGLDTGPTFAQVRTPIAPGDTAETLHERLSRLGAVLLEQALPDYLAGRRIPVPQPTEGVTLAPPLTKDNGRLDFSLPATTLEYQIRGFTPWPGAHASWRGKRLKVLAVAVLPTGGLPGTVVGVGPEGLDIACGQGSLRLREIQLEGGRRMRTGEFLSGHPVALGERPFDEEGSKSK